MSIETDVLAWPSREPCPSCGEPRGVSDPCVMCGDSARRKVASPDAHQRYRDESDLRIPPRRTQWGMHIQWATKGQSR